MKHFRFSDEELNKLSTICDEKNIVKSIEALFGKGMVGDICQGLDHTMDHLTELNHKLEFNDLLGKDFVKIIICFENQVEALRKISLKIFVNELASAVDDKVSPEELLKAAENIIKSCNPNESDSKNKNKD